MTGKFLPNQFSVSNLKGHGICIILKGAQIHIQIVMFSNISQMNTCSQVVCLGMIKTLHNKY